MPATLSIYDETLSGQKTLALTLDALTERMTVRELIRARIYQEVQDHQQRQPAVFTGLVRPAAGAKARRPGIDWQKQCEAALEAFARNGFFVLVDNRQAESLDESFEVRADSEVSFVKLIPLVGG